MKKIYILSLLLFLLNSSLFSQGWEWRVPVSGHPVLVVNDDADNLFACLEGSNSITISKFDPSGIPLWSKVVSGLDIYFVTAETDRNNNIVLLVNANTPVTLDGITYTPSGQGSCAIIKLSPSGSVLHYQMFGTGSRLMGQDIFINSSNEYYIAGGFSDDLVFNSHLIEGDSLFGGFFIKTDSAFNVIWAESALINSGAEFAGAYVSQVAETAGGNLYLLMFTASGGVAINGQTIPGGGDFICYLDPWRNFISSTALSGYYDFTTYSNLQVIAEDAFASELFAHHGYSSAIVKADAGGDSSRAYISNGRCAYDVYNGNVYYSTVACSGCPIGSGSEVIYSKIGSYDPGFNSVSYYSDTACVESSFFSMAVIDPVHYYFSGSASDIPGNFVGKYNASALIGMAEINEQALRFFPNPATNELTIDAPDLNGEVISIYDPLGSVVYRKKLCGNARINISDLTPSAYILEVSGNRKIFIKQ